LFTMGTKLLNKNIFFLLLLLSIFSSCATVEIVPFPDENIIRVAAVGDSITYGKYIDDRAKNAYPALLEDKLGLLWDVRNFGVSGATLLKSGNKPYWKMAQLTDAYNYQPELVIIKLGTNDSKGVNWFYKDQFIADYIEFITSFQNLLSRPKVFICYPVPAYADRLGIRDAIIREEILPLIDLVAEKTGVHIIDLYTALSDKKEMFPDSIHPDAEGAKLIAEIIYQEIR